MVLCNVFPLGLKLSRRVLTCCWGSMITVLSVTLGDGSTDAGLGAASSSLRLLLGSERARTKHKRMREAVVASLEGLQKAARLSNVLGNRKLNVIILVLNIGI